MTPRNIGWLLLVTGLLAIGAAYLLLGAGVSGNLPALMMIYGVGATLAGPLLLATPCRSTSPPLLLAAGTIVAVVIAGFVLILMYPADGAEAPVVLGLPRRAAMVLLGVGLLPALVLPWAYARSVSRDKLDPESIRTFMTECRAARPGGRAE